MKGLDMNFNRKLQS